MAIYRELLFNNVSGLLATNFPVLHRILEGGAWERLVHDFFRDHRCRTPHFPEIAHELMEYLKNERPETEKDPAFLAELAHYEWVELGVGISQEDNRAESADPNGDLIDGVPVKSRLAWNLTYHYPVHRISPDFVPEEPENTHLVVYRDRQEQVRFLEINAVTQRLLQLMDEAPEASGRQLLQKIALELEHPDPEVVVSHGAKVLEDLRTCGILLGTRVGTQQ